MEKSLPDNPDSLETQPIGPNRIVFLLIDSWGVGQNHPGNVFFELKLKNFSTLVKKYPIALLSDHNSTSAQRYESLGANGLLTKTLAESGFSQLNITESEKLIDSWYYLNGRRDAKLNNENLQVVSSEIGDRQDNYKQVSTKITDLALSAIKKEAANFIFVSLANLDLVSATGNLEAAKDAAKLLDKNIGRIVNAVLKNKGLLIIGAAYGRAEAMINLATDLPNLGISNNPVPFMIIGAEYEGKTIGLSDPLNSDLSLLATAGKLDDVTPTILHILNLKTPDGLKGESLI
jgi:2,3-bisphosphoglycerate-independent phosphoglycerate mutase